MEVNQTKIKTELIKDESKEYKVEFRWVDNSFRDGGK